MCRIGYQTDSDDGRTELLQAAKEAALALAPFIYGGPDGHAKDVRRQRFQNLKAAITKAEGRGK